MVKLQIQFPRHIFVILLIFWCHLLSLYVIAKSATGDTLNLHTSRLNNETVTDHPLLTFKKGRPNYEKILRVPINIIEFPFWILGCGLESSLHFVESNHVVERIERLQDWLDQNKLLLDDGSQGDGSGIGVLYGFYRNWSKTKVSLSGAFTYRAYQQYRINLEIPDLIIPELELNAWLQYRFRTKDNFYGIGQDSRCEHRSQYKQANVNSGLELTYKVSTLKISGLLDWTKYDRIDNSYGDDYPSTLNAFPDVVGKDGANLLGLGCKINHPLILYKGLPGAERGIELEACSYFDMDNNNIYGFNRYSMVIYQCIPLFWEDRVLAFRILGSTIDVHKNKTIPFFSLNKFGGWENLRGYESLRFRDLDTFLINIEYRYPIWNIGLENDLALDLVYFFDSGMVSSAIEDELAMDNLLHTYGVSLRLRKDLGTVIRLNLARSSESLLIGLKFGKDF